MTKRVAYISGPIAGYPELNEAMFRAAKRRLEAERGARKFRYDKAIVPHDVPAWQHEEPCPPSYVQNGDHTAACYLRTDLIVMLTQAQDIWMLPGWEASVGARLEMQVAAACGLGVKFFHRQELGCAHNGHGWGLCDDALCWNYRKPHGFVTADDVASAVRRVGEVSGLDTMPCLHPLHGMGPRCRTAHCPNYYGRHMT